MFKMQHVNPFQHFNRLRECSIILMPMADVCASQDKKPGPIKVAAYLAAITTSSLLYKSNGGDLDTYQMLLASLVGWLTGGLFI